MYTEKRWLKWYPNDVAPSYSYPKQNLAAFLIHAAERNPSHAAVHFLGKRLTYAELLGESRRFANALTRIGIGKGDRVAIMLPNCPHTIIAYYGALMTGAIVVQTNPMYTERELQHQLSDSGAVLLVTLDLLHKRVLAVKQRTALRHLIVGSIKDYLPFPKNVLYPYAAKKGRSDLQVRYSSEVLNYKQLLRESSPDPVTVDIDAERDLALLQYTGGTTGLSKGVMLTHYNLVSNTIQNVKWCYDVEAGKEKHLAVLPIFHVFGMTVLMNYAIHQGDTLIMLPRFEPGAVLKAISKFRPSVFPGAPTMYVALINHPDNRDYDLSSIKVCVSGAAPLPLEVQETFEELTGGRLIEGYGLTEASPVTHGNPVWGRRKIGTIGLPFPDTDAKVIDPETGEEVPPGEIGELIVRGPQVMAGYWNREEDTKSALKDGWLYTGDFARMDEEGYFSIVDRKKDLIIAGGFNIYPREIEEVLYEHPSVKEAVAVGVPDSYRGETVRAYVVIKEGASVSERELDEWCRDRLAAFKVPRSYVFRDNLPMSMAGKVLRRKLFEEEQEKKKFN